LLTGFGAPSCVVREAFLSSAFHFDAEGKRGKRLPIKINEQTIEYYYAPDTINNTNNENII
jgi:hypothetical protein